MSPDALFFCAQTNEVGVVELLLLCMRVSCPLFNGREDAGKMEVLASQGLWICGLQMDLEV